MNVREAAFLSLTRCESSNKFSNLEIDAAIKKYGFTGSDRAFFTALVYGVVEKRITLDYYIGRFSSKPVEKIENKLLTILRLGVYQILFLDRVPDRAAVNESVELAKLRVHKGADGFVNGVLRSLIRGKDTVTLPESGTPEYFSVKYACPIWLCEMWSEMYGQTVCEEILRSTNKIPYITLRTNTLKTSREELIKKLSELDIEAGMTLYAREGVQLKEFASVSEITPLADGLCFVQDEASQLCSVALGAKAGDTVIDTCSCPGGKSFGIAMDMGNRGHIISLDIHESKLSLVRKGARCLGIDIIETAVQNGTKLNETYTGIADRVLCDVPCSGLGVIAKKPDLRHKPHEDIARLPDIQYRILENAAKYVKKGGVLLYSTCTLNKAENEEVAEKFLMCHPGFTPCSDMMPDRKAILTMFPHQKGTDGFFMAKFVKS